MKHLFVPYEIAMQLKEKGFDELCMGCYYKSDDPGQSVAFEPKYGDHQNNYTHYTIGVRNSEYCHRDTYATFDKVTAPLYQQVVDWFREKHRIFIEPDNTQHDNYGFIVYKYAYLEGKNTVKNPDYYTAFTQAITQAIKRI